MSWEDSSVQKAGTALFIAVARNEPMPIANRASPPIANRASPPIANRASPPIANAGTESPPDDGVAVYNEERW